jgi:hypothetical protein
MSRKDTVYGHRHIDSLKELERIQLEMRKRYNLDIKKLEADALMAKRSKKTAFFGGDMLKEIKKMRGFKNER